MHLSQWHPGEEVLLLRPDDASLHSETPGIGRVRDMRRSKDP